MRASLQRLLSEEVLARDFRVAGMPSRDEFCDDHVVDLYKLLVLRPPELGAVANQATALWRWVLALSGEYPKRLPHGKGAQRQAAKAVWLAAKSAAEHGGKTARGGGGYRPRKLVQSSARKFHGVEDEHEEEPPNENDVEPGTGSLAAAFDEAVAAPLQTRSGEVQTRSGEAGVHSG